MASRVNFRFLLILFIVGAVVVGILGGLWYFKVRTDVTRSLTQAREHAAAGEFRRARTYYMRAVGKEPSNLNYLKLYQESLLQIQPDTADEARELYREYIGSLRHAAVHRPTDAEAHLALLEEMHRAARLTNSWSYTESMLEMADDMWEAVPASDPKRVYAKLYHGIARVSPWMQDRLTDDEIAEGVVELKDEFLAEVPDSDSAWSALIGGLFTEMVRLREAGQVVRAVEKSREMHDALKTARDRVPDGPEVLVTSIRIAIDDYQQDPTGVDNVTLLADANRLVKIIAEYDDPWLYTQAGIVLQRLYWLPDRPSSVDFLEGFLAKNPDAHNIRLLKGRLHYFRDELDEATEETAHIIDAPLLTVGFVSQYQFDLKKRAAGLNVDIAVRRWDAADPASDERDALVAVIETKVADLEAMVQNQDGDFLLTRARGQLEYARGNYARAASLFTQIARSGEMDDFQTHLFFALALERQGDPGAASKLLADILAAQPGNVRVMVHLAGLHERSGEFEEASKLVEHALALNANDETALELKERLDSQLAVEAGGEVGEISTVIDAANVAFQSGDTPAARAVLLAAHSRFPADLQIINALVLVEIRDGNLAEARRYVDLGLAEAPRSRVFLVHKANLEETDKIKAVENYMEDVFPDADRRAVETLLAMASLNLQFAESADGFEADGRPEDAARQREQAARALEKEKEYRAKVEVIAADDPRFLEYRFVRAVIDEKWDEAARVVERAAALNIDQADGEVYRGRLAIGKGEYQQATIHFRNATDRIPYSATAWRQLAASYRAVGNLSEALDALEASYGNDPRDLTTIIEYARLLSQTGNSTRALSVLRKGRRLDGRNQELREMWLVAETAAGDAAEALRERRRIYRDNPDDKRNAATLAAFLGRTKPTRELILDKDGKELYSFERWNRLPAQSKRGGQKSREDVIQEVREIWWREADAIVQTLEKPEDRDLAWHMLSAGLLRGRGENVKGETLLRNYAAAQTDPKARLDAEIAIGLHLREVGRTDDAIEVLLAARQYQGEEGYLADLAVGELLYQRARYADAVPFLQHAVDRAASRQAQLMLAESLLKSDQLPAARQVVRDLNDGEDADVASLILQASLSLAEASEAWDANDEAKIKASYAENERLLARAEALDPNDPMPHILRAVATMHRYRRTGESIILEDALRHLARADEIRSDFVRTSMTRVEVLTAKGDQSAAIAELRRVLEREPRHDSARQELARRLIGIGRPEGAIETVEAAIRVSPGSARWHIVLADLYYAMQQNVRRELRTLDPQSSESRRKRQDMVRYQQGVDDSYAAALKLSPSVEILRRRADRLLGLDPPKFKQAMIAIETYGPEVDQNPKIQTLYARALHHDKQEDLALANMRKAYAEFKEFIQAGKLPPADIAYWYQNLIAMLTPARIADIEKLARELCGDSPDSYELYSLAGAWGMTGTDGFSHAIELFNEALRLAPKDDAPHLVDIYTDLGVAQLMTGQDSAALQSFRKVIEQDPNNAEILNNIAYLLCENENDPVAALSYAIRAKEADPTSPPILDTLGWIQFRLDNCEEAERNIRDAVQRHDTAEKQFHLANIYLTCKKEAELAQRALARAAAMSPDPELSAKINRLAADIQRTQGRDRQ